MLYHQQPLQFHGEYLQPLNEMRKDNEELYHIIAKKYEWRSGIMEMNIPILDCLWNDVIFFSSVHPEKFKELYESLGMEWNSKKWFEVNPEEIADFEQKAVIYAKHKKGVEKIREFSPPQKEKKDFKLNPQFVEPFSIEALQQYQEIPAYTKSYYKNRLEMEERILVFHGIPHVLYQGSLHKDQLKSMLVE